MPVIQSRTRKQIRQSIGYNLGVLETGTTYDAGSTTTLISLTFVGGDDNYNGKQITVFDTSTDAIDSRIVSDYLASAYRITLQQALSFSTVAGDTYEIWDAPYSQSLIHEFMDQAIHAATGLVYDPIENTSLHADGKSLRYDIPSNISMIKRIEYRNAISFAELHTCKSAFDEQSTVVGTTLNGAISSTTATSVPVASASILRADQQIMVGSEKMTISSISSNTLTVARGAGGTTAATHSDGASVLVFPIVDTEDKKRGTGSNKLIFSTSASAGQIVSDSITSIDISKYDYLEGWAKITRSNETAISAGNLKILLDDTANCASPLETLQIPALSDDTWTFFRVKLTNPELDTAIISVGLEYDSDLDACTVWLDDLKVVKNDTAVWERLDNKLWDIDKESRDLVLRDSGKNQAGYSLLKILGGDKPALPSADSDPIEIDPDYIINKACEIALGPINSAGVGTDPDQNRWARLDFRTLANQAMRRFPMLVNVRLVE